MGTGTSILSSRAPPLIYCTLFLSSCPRFILSSRLTHPTSCPSFFLCPQSAVAHYHSIVSPCAFRSRDFPCSSRSSPVQIGSTRPIPALSSLTPRTTIIPLPSIPPHSFFPFPILSSSSISQASLHSPAASPCL